MAIFGLDSLLTRDNMVKARKWLVKTVPGAILGAYVTKKGSEVLHHYIDSHKETVKYMADKAAETGSYVHATRDGEYTFDARKKSEAPENVDGEFADADAPEAIPEAV